MPLIRPMTGTDIPAVSELHVRSWQFAYRGLIPQSHLDGLDVAENAERRRGWFDAAAGRTDDLVAEDATGTVIGWACLGPYRRDESDSEALEGDGELYAIYLRPEHLGRGVGLALARAVIERAVARGFPWLRLWVLEGNERARSFYERVGFAFDGATEPFTVSGVDVPEVRYALRLPTAHPAP